MTFCKSAMKRHLPTHNGPVCELFISRNRSAKACLVQIETRIANCQIQSQSIRSRNVLLRVANEKKCTSNLILNIVISPMLFYPKRAAKHKPDSDANQYFNLDGAPFITTKL